MFHFLVLLLNTGICTDAKSRKTFKMDIKLKIDVEAKISINGFISVDYRHLSSTSLLAEITKPFILQMGIL